MGKISKSVKGLNDKIMPLTLGISKDTWDNFKILATAKNYTLNDYVVALINKEIGEKKSMLDALKKDVQAADALTPTAVEN